MKDMVEDGLYKGTDLLWSFLNSDLIESLLGNLTMLSLIIGICHTVLIYIHPKYKSEFRSLVFKKMLKLI